MVPGLCDSLFSPEDSWYPENPVSFATIRCSAPEPGAKTRTCAGQTIPCATAGFREWRKARARAVSATIDQAADQGRSADAGDSRYLSKEPEIGGRWWWGVGCHQRVVLTLHCLACWSGQQQAHTQQRMTCVPPHRAGRAPSLGKAARSRARRRGSS